jgi:hypothetical protein
MQEMLLPEDLRTELVVLYEDLQAQYEDTAARLPLSCQGCPDNCCDSWFFHHTSIEWAFLWQGLRSLDARSRAALVQRAEEYREASAKLLAQGKRPQLPCPLLDQGRCRLYAFRLLVCRMHGIPAHLTLPNGQQVQFPGCFRCQEIVREYPPDRSVPSMDRTSIFTRLAQLEARFLNTQGPGLPKIKKTLAEMIVQGPPCWPR